VFVQAAGAKDLSDLIEGLALGWYQLEASLVRQIFETANHGDVVAQEILAWAGSELGETTKAVIRQLAIQDDTFDIILIGSVFKGGNLFLEPFKKVITDFATGARFIRLMVPPVAGAVLLGMEQVGLRDEQVRSKLFDSISKFKQP
jgi:N-acetylglucosamine kinase-like BadF-type ATPase